MAEFQFNSIIPELSVRNLQASIDFYVNCLGFIVEYERPECMFAFISLHGTQLMIEQTNGHWETGALEYPFGRGMNFQILVPDAAILVTALQTKNTC